MRVSVYYLMVIMMIMNLSAAFSSNIGVRGSVYSIAESDLLVGIYQKLSNMEKRGEIEKLNHEALERTVAHIRRPVPVSGVSDLTADQKPKTVDLDMSVRLQHDIKNKEGEIIAKKGLLINPLSYMTFRETFVFVDGDNEAQMQWVKEFLRKQTLAGNKTKIILVKGDIKDDSNFLNTRIYFDQYGKLCSRFGIKHTPTIVYQPHKGANYSDKIRVEEIAIG